MLDEIIGPAGAQLAALDPELAGRLSNTAPRLVETEPARARFRLFDAIAGFWRRAAARQPLLLVIDDLSLRRCAVRLLEFLMANSDGSCLMVLGSYRDAEVRRQHPLADTLSQLHRNAPVQRFLLGGFSLAETTRFVAAAAGIAAPEMAAALHERTGGHPLFLAELARELRQSAAAVSATAGLSLPVVPRGVREVIGTRLNRLTPPGVRILQTAAVFGREFRLDLLCRVLDELSKEQVLATIEEATTASLISESAEQDCYQFAHALVRDSLYDELPARRRAALHKDGAALETHYQDDLTACLSTLAHHYHAAGLPGNAAGNAAGDSVKAISTPAAQPSGRCRRTKKRRATTCAPVRRCRWGLLATPSEARCCWAWAMHRTVLAPVHWRWPPLPRRRTAPSMGDAALLAASALGFADTQWRLGYKKGGPAVALIREALGQASLSHAHAHTRSALLSALCQALLFTNQPDEAETAFREAVAIARQLDDPLALFRALCAILPGRWYPDRWRCASLRHARRSNSPGTSIIRPVRRPTSPAGTPAT